MKAIQKTHLACLLISLRASIALAQPGMVDPTYNINDYGTGNGVDYYLYCAAAQSSGKVILGGEFYHYDNHEASMIFRLNMDGTPDLSFNIGAGFNHTVYDVVVLPNDRLLVAGDFTSYDGASCGRIVKLNVDGSIFLPFNAGGSGANSNISRIFNQSDGKIILAGRFSEYNGTICNNLVRVENDGTVDPTFSSSSGFQTAGFDFLRLNSIVQQPDGKLIIAGNFMSYDNVASQGLVRLNQDGSIDPTFSVGSGVSGGSTPNVTHIHLMSDARMVISGSFSSYNGHAGIGIARVMPDGSYDTTFVVNGGFSGSCSRTYPLPDGKLLALGSPTYAGNPVSYMAVIDSTGAYVSAFNAGPGPNNMVTQLIQLPNGRFLSYGSFYMFDGFYRNKTALLESDGTLVPEVMGLSGFNGSISCIEVLPDGKALVSGSFNRYGAMPLNGLSRLMPYGEIDGSFNSSLNPNGTVYDMAHQPDGKHLAGGSYFSTYDGQAVSNLIRLNPDGTLDSTFNAQINSTVYAVLVRPDGKILIGGTFTSVDGQPVSKIALLNADGSMDSGFNTAISPNFVKCLALQPDGNMLVGGNLVYPEQALMVRLFPDGAIDPTFQTGTGPTWLAGEGTGHPATAAREVTDISSPNTPPPPPPAAEITSINVQTDGKILLTASAVQNFDSIPVRPVFRLLPNGILDSQFQLDASIDFPMYGNYTINKVRAILQPDDKPLITVALGLPSNYTAQAVVRLNNDGSIDQDFYLTQGGNSNVQSLSLTPEGKILAVGSFSGYNGVGRNRIVQLLNDGMLVSSDEPKASSEKSGPNYHYAEGELHVFGCEASGKTELTIMDMQGRVLLRKTIEGPSASLPINVSAGMFVILYSTATTTGSGKIFMGQ